MDQPVILVEGLWAGYERDDDVLENVNLRVEANDFVGIIGPNGGGKTTLLRVLLGLLEPTRGRVEIMGVPASKGRSAIGYVPQHFTLDTEFPMTARDVVRMGRLHKRGLFRHYSAEDDAVVDRALEQVEMLDRADAQVADLSGGQRQRVYIARALAAEPSILLLDEPTASVDPRVRTSIFELLRNLNQHIAILLISHDMAAISSYVKSVGCLNRHLFYQNDRNLTEEMLELAYQCPVDLIAHGVPHRVFGHHHDAEIAAVEEEIA